MWQKIASSQRRCAVLKYVRLHEFISVKSVNLTDSPSLISFPKKIATNCAELPLPPPIDAKVYPLKPCLIEVFWIFQYFEACPPYFTLLGRWLDFNGDAFCQRNCFLRLSRRKTSWVRISILKDESLPWLTEESKKNEKKGKQGQRPEQKEQWRPHTIRDRHDEAD